MIRISIFISSLFCLVATAAHADSSQTITAAERPGSRSVPAQDQGGEGRPSQRRPPREAVEACEDANDGDDCSFEGRNGDDVSGTCERPPNDTDKPLACRPDDAPEGPPGERD